MPGEEAYFFAPPLIKLVVMSLTTLGLYVLYWFYRNWKTIKLRGHDGIMPFWRAVFPLIWLNCFNVLI